MFERVLIANRGEIAVRVIRTLHRMGIEAVAVYTEADRLAPHVALADRAVALRSPAGYLDAESIVAAAVGSGSSAVHPGYGFLSENQMFARACATAGVVFIGPPAEAIDLMGDKINAKRAVAAFGVPTVPGRDQAGLSDEELEAAALEVGLPVVLKPSAGGGGKGMRVVAEADQLAGAIAAARREAVGAFGDGTLLVERYVDRPRHIEMQVFADSHGNVVALGERECSLQRRHQKIVEEAPSPLLDDRIRSAMADSAIAAARACDYVGAGTIEFIVSADQPDQYFFMEMNTRLQVEHPVTEQVLGLDLVELQVRVAAGEELPWKSQAEVPRPRGHAVEARVYAEDPNRDFLPSSGRIVLLEEPAGPSVRVDSGIREGSEVGTSYDPMLAKVIAWAGDRAEALGRLRDALRRTTVIGISTNVGFLIRLLSLPEVAAGELDTRLVETSMARLARPPIPDEVPAAASLLEQPEAVPGDPWATSDGWRLTGPASRRFVWRIGSDTVEVEHRADGGLRVGGRFYERGRAWPTAPQRLAVELDERARELVWAADGENLWVACEGDTWKLTVEETVAIRGGATAAAGGSITSPMPGLVLAVHAKPGDTIEAGQPLVVVEAMKMEHVVVAPSAGVVSQVLVQEGDSVKLNQPLIALRPEETTGRAYKEQPK